jgi:uncharacterized repeat protein (TIGR03803 family)
MVMLRRRFKIDEPRRAGNERGMDKCLWAARAGVLFLLGAATAIDLPAQTFTTLFSFDNTHGANPEAGLVQALNGNFYGTTYNGGVRGYGTVFQITPSGTLTMLHSFCPQTKCKDGVNPVGGLVQTTNGDFYGTTNGGGANGSYGTVFQITPSGTLTTLYSFCAQSGCTDGEYPYAGLIQAANGNFYGTTAGGGVHGDNGTVFQITPSGTLTTLYSFCARPNCADGQLPKAGLVQATNGNFYGTTKNGGANGDSGSVFEITPSGTLTTLYSFCAVINCTAGAGANPYAGLVEAANGDFYGTTAGGGVQSDYGTVFQITPSGTLTTLLSFDGTDGAYPYAGLVQATDGNFYGTTQFGGANAKGTVFQITPSGTLTTLYSFCAQTGCTDGEGPNAVLIQATDGDFYGTTEYGGTNNAGVVFSLSVGLGPFIETTTTAGQAGAAVEILGTDLTGATSVAFNGTAAVFKVAASSLIKTIVPAGATSGTVQVVTPGGTLSSSQPFQVLP